VTPEDVRERLASGASFLGDPRSVLAPDARDAAIVVPLHFDGAALTTYVLVRAGGLRDHAGEVSFPGGKVEPGESFEAAALREAEEEVGLGAEDVEVLGALSPTPVVTRRFLLHPLVVAVRRPPRITSSEHVELHAVPLARWLEDGEVIAVTRSEWSGQELLLPHFPVATHVLYGASALIFFELLARLSGGGLTTQVVEERPWGTRYAGETL